MYVCVVHLRQCERGEGDVWYAGGVRMMCMWGGVRVMCGMREGEGNVWYVWRGEGDVWYEGG